MPAAQTKPQLRHFISRRGTPHRVAYREWGDEQNPSVVLCMHGLSRNGKDFDAVARRLSSRHRVICPDAPGRGESDWLQDTAQYAYPELAEEMVALVRHLGVQRVAWVGTSMGGVLGMIVAATHPDLVSRLLLNDVGAEIDPVGIRRILGYVGKVHSFPDKAQAMAYLQTTYAPFGLTTDAEWETLYAATFVHKDGEVVLAYDPVITKPVAAPQPVAKPSGPVHYWNGWNRIMCPVLILRGADSDLLSKETARRMCERPGTRVTEIPGCGHAPSLLKDDQIELVAAFIDAG